MGFGMGLNRGDSSFAGFNIPNYMNPNENMYKPQNLLNHNNNNNNGNNKLPIQNFGFAPQNLQNIPIMNNGNNTNTNNLAETNENEQKEQKNQD